MDLGDFQIETFPRKERKIIFCEVREKCPFGYTKIDEGCAICRLRKEIPIGNQIRPIFIENEMKVQYGCFTKKDREGTDKLYIQCPFGKIASPECTGCARSNIKILESKTKEIK